MINYSLVLFGWVAEGGGSQAIWDWDKILTFAKNYFTAFFGYEWGDAD